MSIPLLKGLHKASLKTRILHPFDEYWDRRLGISTFGYVPAVGEMNSPDLQMHYEPTPYRAIFRIIRHLDIGPDDTVVDFGSGPGRFAFAASWSGCRRSIGVEIDRSLHHRALDNMRRSTTPPGRTSCECMPAQNFDPIDVSRVYLFHPFGRRTLRTVMDNLRDSLSVKPRRVRIAYNNPVYADIVDSLGIFHKTDEWQGGEPSLPYPVAFWETKH
ncbi:hypothetical protein QBK99_15155 [Corticibacterium sp. UT-5YL-CI-8]|nr:hypothetical protein [Tianweitania sp. UT-5YL-CI-8]